MISKNNIPKFSFISPSVYKIKVHGDLKSSLSERLVGLQIAKKNPEDLDSVSVLIGQINDQAALSGVLNALYENNITIISVNMLKNSDE